MRKRQTQLNLVCSLALGASTMPSAASTGTDELETLLNQPVYAASKYLQDTASAPASVSVLTAGDIRTHGWRTVAEVLNGVRGVYMRNDRSYTYVGVRGFSRPGDYSSRLLVTINGIRVNDNIYDQALGGREFPLEVGLIERVEFIAGPGSSLYGSSAFFGVVNIVTKTAAALGGTQWAVGAGSQRQASVTLRHGGALAGGKVVLSAHLEHRPGGDLYFPEYDDPATHNGVAQGIDGEKDRKLFVQWIQGEWSTSFNYSHRSKEVPTAAYYADFNTPSEVGDRYAVADAQWRQQTSDTEKSFRLAVAQYRFLDRSQYGEDTNYYEQTGRWLTIEGQWLYRGWQDHVVVLGAEAQRSFRITQSVAVVGPADFQDTMNADSKRFGFFGHDDWRFAEKWRLSLGVRVDRLLSGGTELTPRLALLWQPRADLHLKLLDGWAYREPNIWESAPGDDIQLANPDLRSERLRATELAFDWRAAEGLRLAGSLYRNQIRDLIEYSPVSIDPFLVKYQNLGKARGQGVELEADYVAPAGWRVRTSWSRSSSTGGQAGQALANAPRSLTKAHATVPLPWAGTRIGLEWLRTGQRVTYRGSRMPSVALTNATWRVAPAGTRWTFSSSIYNLFNKAYADPGGPETRQDTLARDGRRVQLGVEWLF